MKMCSRHVIDINTAIIRKGMRRYKSDSVELNQRFIASWLAGQVRPQEFLALPVAIMEVLKKFQDVVGIEYIEGVLHVRNREFCPLCELPRLMQNVEAGSIWIDNVTDALVLFCEVNNLKRD